MHCVVLILVYAIAGKSNDVKCPKACCAHMLDMCVEDVMSRTPQEAQCCCT